MAGIPEYIQGDIWEDLLPIKAGRSRVVKNPPFPKGHRQLLKKPRDFSKADVVVAELKNKVWSS